MTLTLELSPEREAALKAQAESRGMSAEAWLLAMTELLAPSTSIADMQKTDPKEWMRQFRGWAQGHDTTTPLLSDEAVGRAGIYPDRV